MIANARCLLCATFFLYSSLVGYWDPTCLSQSIDTSILQEPRYKKLKSSCLQEIEGSWCPQEKAELLMDLILLIKPACSVEIGVWDGASLLPIALALKYTKQGKVYGIDAWANAIATRYWEDTDPNKPWWSVVDMNAIYHICKNRITSHDLYGYCKLIPSASQYAVSRFNHIDFLHLDGDCSEIGSLQDLELYLPKVVPGGYILLSNVLSTTLGKQTKFSSFAFLAKEYEIISEIEEGNAILFRKPLTAYHSRP